MKTMGTKEGDGAGPGLYMSAAAMTGQEKMRGYLPRGDIIWYLYDRQDRISERLLKKIERLSRRISALEEKG